MNQNWNKTMQETYHENLLSELYDLTMVEQERELTKNEKLRYVHIVDFLQEKDIEIPFGIEI